MILPRRLRLILPITLLTPVLFSQTPSQPASAPATQAGASSSAATVPSISTNVEEVSLDMVVRTKNGKPVTDLIQGDFEITDNGSPVKVSDLHLVTGAPKSARLVTLVFDHLDPGPARTARELAAKILKVIPDQGYTFAVLEMSNRLRLLQPYTENRDLVTTAIGEATAPAPPVPAAAASGPDLTPAEKQLLAAAQGESLSTDFTDRARAKLLLATLEDSQRILEDQHAYPSLSALLAIANTQRHITGRKLVIYFAQGLYANSDARDTIKSVVGQANRSGVTICAVDTSALDQAVSDRMKSASAMAGQNPGAAMGAADALGSSGYARGVSPSGTIGSAMEGAQNMSRMEFDGMDEAKSPLIDLSSGTGGVYFKAGAGLKHPLEELEEDLTSYYEASYVPSIKEYNGEFRPVVIKPLRKNLVIQSRAGYFAVPPEDASGIRPYEMPLLNLLSGDKLPTEVAFESQVMRLGDLPDGNTGDLTVAVPVSSLLVKDDANSHLSSVHVAIVAQIKDAKGAVLQRFSEDLPRHDAPDVLRSPEGRTIVMQRHFTAAPGTYTLETAVMDRLGNKAGAQRSSFTIDAPPKGPALSDIALVSRVEPLHEDTSSFEPMRYRNGRVVPNLDTQLPENTKTLSLFFMVHPVTGSAPELSLEILRNNELLGKMPIELSQTGPGALPYLGTLQGHVFPPGSYQVKAILSQGGQTATSTTSFTVDGTIAAQNASNASFSMSDEKSEAAAAAASERAADAKLTSTAVLSNSKFAISIPANPVPPPSADQISVMIEGARQRALAWSDSLPNFFCVEVTDRSIDSSAHGDWKHRDTIVQMMRYVDKQETRTTLEINGERSHADASDIEGARSVGEFGGMLRLVFDPAAHAQFTWKEADVLDGQPVQVFEFKVAREHSDFSLTGENNRAMAVAFHGTVWLDTATRSVRRITLQADDIPQNFLVHATSLSVDYSWIAISNHDYLLPVRGAVSLREGRHEAVLNEFEFRDYRRFGAQIRILSKREAAAIQQNTTVQKP